MLLRNKLSSWLEWKDSSAVFLTPYLFTNGPFRHQLRWKFIFRVSAPRVSSFSHQNLHSFHLSFMILQRTDNVQGSVSTECLKYIHTETHITYLCVFGLVRFAKDTSALRWFKKYQNVGALNVNTTNWLTLTFTMDSEDGWSRKSCKSSTFASSQTMWRQVRPLFRSCGMEQEILHEYKVIFAASKSGDTADATLHQIWGVILNMWFCNPQ